MRRVSEGVRGKVSEEREGRGWQSKGVRRRKGRGGKERE